MSLVGQIEDRARLAGVPVPSALAESLASYLGILARWNRTINLTALPVDPPTDDAVDRLIVEPLVAAARVGAADRFLIDVGSGGGSPAIPMKLAAPALRVVLVEMKSRKAAFLREAARHLAIGGQEVEHCTLAELVTRGHWNATADIVTIRAVRVDGALVRGVEAVRRPGGRVFWFGAAGERIEAGAAGFLSPVAPERVPLPSGSELAIFTAGSA